MKSMLITAMALCALTAVGCDPSASATPEIKSTTTTSGSDAPKVATETTPATTPTPATPGQDGTVDLKAKPEDGDTVAVLDTSMGQIVIRFFPQVAPKHVENFTTLAKKSFYDGTKFHRVIKGFMIQGGDPYTKPGNEKGPAGTGGPGYTVKAEFNSIPHEPGIVSMARSSDPDSAGSQFFIVHKASPSLDGQYTVFGQVVKGMDVVNKIAETPTDGNDRPLKDVVLKKVTITTWPVK